MHTRQDRPLQGSLENSESSFWRELWCVLFPGSGRGGLDSVELLVLSLLLEGDLNGSLQKKKGGVLE